jgi:hypothetical protein
VPDIRNAAEEYMGRARQFSTLDHAVRYGAKLDQYLLISPDASETSIFVPSAEGLPRQFARLLVAEAVGREDASSWRDHPQYDIALEIAEAHRALCKP